MERGCFRVSRHSDRQRQARQRLSRCRQCQGSARLAPPRGHLAHARDGGERAPTEGQEGDRSVRVLPSPERIGRGGDDAPAGHPGSSRRSPRRLDLGPHRAGRKGAARSRAFQRARERERRNELLEEPGSAPEGVCASVREHGRGGRGERNPRGGARTTGRIHGGSGASEGESRFGTRVSGAHDVHRRRARGVLDGRRRSQSNEHLSESRPSAALEYAASDLRLQPDRRILVGALDPQRPGVFLFPALEEPTRRTHEAGTR